MMVESLTARYNSQNSLLYDIILYSPFVALISAYNGLLQIKFVGLNITYMCILERKWPIVWNLILFSTPMHTG